MVLSLASVLLIDVITSLSLFNWDSVGIVEGKDGSIYEITSAKTIHYIDQVQKLYRDDGIGKGMKYRIYSDRSNIRWNNAINLMLSNILINYFQRG